MLGHLEPSGASGNTVSRRTATSLRLYQINEITHVGAQAWNRCFHGANPFVRFEFLKALETHGCATPGTGWTPCHAILENDEGTVVAAAPLYLKTHSFGEFVFDFSWAEASLRAGLPYYPKLVCTVPFTPVAGPKLGAVDPHARSALAVGLRALAEAEKRPSLHVLFLSDEDVLALTGLNYIPRETLQFHWRNKGYRNFDEFLAALAHDKRKKIRRERQRVQQAGLRHEWVPGAALTEAQWAKVYALYANTYIQRGQAPYLSLDFFLDYGRQPGTPIRLVQVLDGARLIAVAINVRSGDTLYGRHWGAAESYHSLHFETCYYQGVEYCIREGLAHFDAGAQGGHKLARGFDPEIMRSAHWVADSALSAAVRRAVNQERELIRAEGRILQHRGAYRKRDSGI